MASLTGPSPGTKDEASKQVRCRRQAIIGRVVRAYVCSWLGTGWPQGGYYSPSGRTCRGFNLFTLRESLTLREVSHEEYMLCCVPG